MPIKIIACEVMKEELLAVINCHGAEFEFVSMGLHLYPEKLQKELQRIIDSSNGFSRIVLAFGLCGGAARGLTSNYSILTIPRVHDCIPILLGSQDAYDKARKEEAGTFYLSCGWFKGEKPTISEYRRISEKYGEKKARNIYKRMYASYSRMLFIKTGNPGEEAAFNMASETSGLLELELKTTQGSTEYFNKIVCGPWEDLHFINIAPYGKIEYEDFINCYALY